MSFKYSLNAQLAIKTSSKVGRSIARAEYVNGEHSHLIAHVNGQGDHAEVWISEGLLELAAPPGDEAKVAG